MCKEGLENMKLQKVKQNTILFQVCTYVFLLIIFISMILISNAYYFHTENRHIFLPILGAISGLILIIFILIINISKRKKAENELFRLNNDLEQIVKEKTAHLQQEIFERMETKKKLKEQLHFLEVLIDTIPTPIFYKDTEGLYQGCNEAFATNIAFSKNEIKGRSVYDISPKHLADIYHKADAALLRNPGTQVYESTVQLKDGTCRNVIFNKATYTNMDGNIAGMVGIITDITLRKEMENKLMESEEKYRLVFENAPVGISQFDNNGLITDVNSSTVKIINSSKESLMGLNLMNLSNQEMIHAIKKALSGELGKYEGNYLPITSNKNIYLKTTLAPLKRNGVIIGGVGIMEDITELRHTQDMVREKDKLAVMGQMAAGLAHEIRNPLTGIRGFAELIMDRYSNNESLVDYVSIIFAEANQANKVITEFLQLAGPHKPEFKEHSINKLLQEFIDIVEPQAFLTNVKVAYEERNLLYCMLDDVQIKQVLLNMCKNAMEAMPAGGIIKVTTGLSCNNNELYIDIQDTGYGIPQDMLEKIWIPFYTTKDEGPGLGLSISYSIINAHKGRIQVESNKEGTCFRIYLPCVKLELQSDDCRTA